VRLAVDVLFSQQAVGDAHEFVPAGSRVTRLTLTSLELQSVTEDA
jgi:hypothetical protein